MYDCCEKEDYRSLDRKNGQNHSLRLGDFAINFEVFAEVNSIFLVHVTDNSQFMHEE